VCLKHLPSASSQPNARYNSDTVPWQRVINSKGVISPRSGSTVGGKVLMITNTSAEGPTAPHTTRQYLPKKAFRSTVEILENEQWTSRFMDGFLMNYQAARQRTLTLTITRMTVATTITYSFLSSRCLCRQSSS
jgi:hypothetical protein